MKLSLKKILETLKEESLDDYDIRHPYYQFKDGYILGQSVGIDPEFDTEKRIAREMKQVQHESEPFKIAYEFAMKQKLASQPTINSQVELLNLAKNMVGHLAS